MFQGEVSRASFLILVPSLARADPATPPFAGPFALVLLPRKSRRPSAIVVIMGCNSSRAKASPGHSPAVSKVSGSARTGAEPAAATAAEAPGKSPVSEPEGEVHTRALAQPSTSLPNPKRAPHK